LKPESTAPLAVIAGEDADYERLNLARDAVAPWEDGAHIDNRRGTYEWWHFDAHLDDGSSLVVVFMNKDLATPSDPLTPTIRLDLDLADGRNYQKLATYAPGAYLRFASRLRIEHHRGGELVEGHSDDAIWELMYFEHARPQ
jgi:hypothetical protein